LTNKSDKLLIVFLSNAIKGQIKTNISRVLGEENTLGIYKYLLQLNRDATKAVKADKWVCYSNFIDRNDIYHPSKYQKKLQAGRILGEKLWNCFRWGFQREYKSIVLLSVDIPGISTELIEDAFSKLQTNNVVLGPARDGGYYLIGMNIPVKDIFFRKKWGSKKVFPAMLDDLHRLDIDYSLCQTLGDIDHHTDIHYLASHLQFIIE
jgi:uncharacterized protein